jgi:hypothetical protein
MSLSASRALSLQVTTCYKLEFERGKWWSQVDHVTGKWTQKLTGRQLKFCLNGKLQIDCLHKFKR